MKKNCYVIGVAAFLHIMFFCNIVLANESDFIYDSKGKRDPFISLIGQRIKVTEAEVLESIDDLLVEGIIIDPAQGSGAILNGQILKIGDFIGGFRLDKVTRYHVYLSREGKSYALLYRSREEDEQEQGY